MKFNTYLFDFDGTLVDSMPTYASVMLRVLDENGINYEKGILKIITPLGCHGTAKYCDEHFDLKISQEEMVDLILGYAYEEYEHRIPAKANVIETLKKLKSRGADLHILTASPHKTLDVCLKRLGMYDLFTNVWSCEDFNTTKSDPEIYKKAAELIGKPIGEILFLDDNYNADKAASEAGLRVCGVYDPSSEEYTEDIKRVSDYYIKDFSELLGF